MIQLNLDEARSQMQELTTAILQDQRANIYPPKDEVEATIKTFYRSFAEQEPQFVWLANPWQLTYAPAFYTGFTRKQIRVVDVQERICKRYRDMLISEIGLEQFDFLFASLWESQTEQQIRALSDLVGAEVDLLERDRIQRHGDLARGLQERLMSKVYRRGLNLETAVLSRMGNQISWFAVEHYTGKEPPWSHMSSSHRIALDANFDWSGTAVPAPDAIPPGIEWGHLIRLRQTLSTFGDKCLILCPDEYAREELRNFEQLAKSVHSVACFPEVCFLSEPPLCFSSPNDRYHSAQGPAIAYAEGLNIYCWNGVRVASRAIELEPTLYRIENEHNIEVMRVFIERYGYERYLTDSKAQKIQQDQRGALYRIDTKAGQAMTLLAVTNSTPEPDGSFKRYFLQVPPEMRTAQEAVAWTFSMNAGEYQPLKES